MKYVVEIYDSIGPKVHFVTVTSVNIEKVLVSTTFAQSQSVTVSTTVISKSLFES